MILIEPKIRALKLAKVEVYAFMYLPFTIQITIIRTYVRILLRKSSAPKVNKINMKCFFFLFVEYRPS